MIEVFKQVLQRHSEANIDLIKVDGIADQAHMELAAHQLGPRNPLVNKLLTGAVKVLFTGEGKDRRQYNHKNDRYLTLKVSESRAVLYLNGEEDAEFQVESMQSIEERLLIAHRKFSACNEFDPDSANEIKNLGYDSALELFRIDNPFAEGTAASELFLEGYRDGMREFANGL